MGKKPKDFDVGTDAHPKEIAKLFGNSRIIGRRFRLVQVFFKGGKIIEVSTFRRSAQQEDDEVLSANNTFGTPAEDAMRRDLTINAMFYNIADYSIVDYVDGLGDLKAGLIRAVGDPEVRFLRDPVRIMRAVRHASRIDFRLTPATLDAVEMPPGQTEPLPCQPDPGRALARSFGRSRRPLAGAGPRDQGALQPVPHPGAPTMGTRTPTSGPGPANCFASLTDCGARDKKWTNPWRWPACSGPSWRS